MTSLFLPSWRPGPARESITEFLAASEQIPPRERVAVFDNDGTLWCEKPLYAQEAFFLTVLAERAATDPALRVRPEFALLVDHDDAEREFAYVSVPGTFEATEDITDVAQRSGWTIASMRRDWSTVFPE